MADLSEEKKKFIAKLEQSTPRKEYRFNRLGLRLELPAYLDVNVWDVGVHDKPVDFMINLIVPGKLEPWKMDFQHGRDLAIQKRIREFKKFETEREPLGMSYVFRDLSSKSTGLHIIYCYSQPVKNKKISSRFIAGHEEMHAYTCLLAEEGLVRLYPNCRKKALQELGRKYPELAANIFSYYDTGKSEVLAHCGGIIHNSQHGIPIKTTFRVMSAVAERSKQEYPSFQSELEEAVKLLS